MLYLFVRTRPRRVPPAIASQRDLRFAEGFNWNPVFESVIERDAIVLDGVARYSEIGGLLAGWPRCGAVLVASPERFSVVAGPYTK
jgi:hypothetical protein